MTLHHGDCLDVLPALEAESVDAIVTDPPYGLEFMGKEWDGAIGFRRSLNPADAGRDDVFGRTSRRGPEYRAGRLFGQWCEQWGREALRVTKPGGYLLAFGGTRTHHRLVCALEDAGWIIRDELDWIYASGFPKGRANLKPAHEPIVLARKPGPLRMLAIDECRIGTDGGGTHCGDFPEPCSGHTGHGRYSATVHARPEQSWVGGDAGCEHRPHDGSDGRIHGGSVSSRLCCKCGATKTDSTGRWPSNVLLSDPELFDEPNPYVVGSGAVTGPGSFPATTSESMFGIGGYSDPLGPRDTGDSGGYSRFFIIPKADRAERERGLADRPERSVGTRDRKDRQWDIPGSRSTPRANHHPTVKPIDLMRHLVRLVTPPGGTVLDPFLGSGTTAIAAEMEGFAWIGIEREAEYVTIAEARLNGVQKGLGLSA